MPAGLSQRLLTLLQLTRMALVFTAISNSAAGLLLRSKAENGTSLFFESGGRA